MASWSTNKTNILLFQALFSFLCVREFMAFVYDKNIMMSLFFSFFKCLVNEYISLQLSPVELSRGLQKSVKEIVESHCESVSILQNEAHVYTLAKNLWKQKTTCSPLRAVRLWCLVQYCLSLKAQNEEIVNNTE